MEGWGEFIDQHWTTSNTSFKMCFISTLNDFEPVYITVAVDSKNKKRNICLQTALQSWYNNTHGDIMISHSKGGLVGDWKAAP